MTIIETGISTEPRSVAALLAARDCVVEHGATPEQAAALTRVVRAIKDVGDPDGAGRELANVLTARLRGPEWMAKYGCTPFCVMDHAGEDGTPGWHQGPEVVVVSPVPGCQAEPGEGPDEVLSVQVTTVNSEPETFGIESRLWVGYGLDTMELDVDQARELHARLVQFLPQMAAAIELLDEARRGDRPADPVARAKYEAEWDTKRRQIAADLKAAS